MPFHALCPLDSPVLLCRPQRNGALGGPGALSGTDTLDDTFSVAPAPSEALAPSVEPAPSAVPAPSVATAPSVEQTPWMTPSTILSGHRRRLSMPSAPLTVQYVVLSRTTLWAALRPQRHSQSPWCPKRPRSPQWPWRLQRLWPGTREPGAVWATCLHNLEAVGAPPTFDCQCGSFLFLLVFARELGALPKMMGQIRGVLVLGRGYLESRETFAPPPPNFEVVPAPLALAPPAAPAPSVAQAPSVASTPSAVPVPSMSDDP